MLLLSDRQQFHQRPNRDPLDAVLAALVSQNGHAYRLRLHTLKSLNGRPNGLAHSENSVHDQHLLTLDSRETWVYRPGNLLLPQPLWPYGSHGFPQRSCHYETQRHAARFNSSNHLWFLHQALFDCFSDHIGHRSPDKGQSADARSYRIPVNIHIVSITSLDSILSVQQQPDNCVGLDLQLVGNLIS